jgi:hypothetical protein
MIFLKYIIIIIIIIINIIIILIITFLKWYRDSRSLGKSENNNLLFF